MFKKIFVTIAILTSSAAWAESIKINLNEYDQAKLAGEMAKIDLPYRSEEILQEIPYRILLRKYKFLDESQAFYIHCSAEFHADSTHVMNEKCEVGFDYEKSRSGLIESHPGFMPEFSIAEIKDSIIARVLYKTIGNGASPAVFFNSKEQLSFTHPASGEKFWAFRLRVDCKRDAAYRNFSCMVSAVK